MGTLGRSKNENHHHSQHGIDCELYLVVNLDGHLILLLAVPEPQHVEDAAHLEDLVPHPDQLVRFQQQEDC